MQFFTFVIFCDFFVKILCIFCTKWSCVTPGIPFPNTHFSLCAPLCAKWEKLAEKSAHFLGIPVPNFWKIENENQWFPSIVLCKNSPFCIKFTKIFVGVDHDTFFAKSAFFAKCSFSEINQFFSCKFYSTWKRGVLREIQFYTNLRQNTFCASGCHF